MNGKVCAVYRDIIKENTYRFSWQTDKEYFGEITCFYENGKWIIDSEYMGLEFINEVLNFWFRQEKNNDKENGNDKE